MIIYIKKNELTTDTDKISFYIFLGEYLSHCDSDDICCEVKTKYK